MGTHEAVRLVARLAAAYPNATIPEATVALYAEKLADIDPELLKSAVDRVLEASRFFPSIAEVRQSAARIAGVLPPTEAEALAVVRRADRDLPRFRGDGSFAYNERVWEWPEDVAPDTIELLRDVLCRVGDPREEDGKPRFGWEVGFQKTYGAQADELSRLTLADLSLARLPSRQLPIALPEPEAPPPPERADVHAATAALEAVAAMVDEVAGAMSQRATELPSRPAPDESTFQDFSPLVPAFKYRGPADERYFAKLGGNAPSVVRDDTPPELERAEG